MFNTSKFANTKFERRTEAVPVDSLKDFFEEGEKPEFIVQSLTHAEIASCAEKASGNDNLKVLLEAAAGHKPSIKEAVGEILGKADSVPLDTRKRILHLIHGCLTPKLDEGQAVLLSETFPVEFTELTNKILQLTGLGQIAVKKP